MLDNFVLNCKSYDIKENEEFIKKFSLFYNDKITKCDDSYDVFFLKFIDFLRLRINNNEGKINITPIIDIFKNNNHNLLFVKEKCALFTSLLYNSLIQYYPGELDILEKIIVSELNNDDSYQIALVIYNYAKNWLDSMDDNFYIACNTISNLGYTNLTNKLIMELKNKEEKIKGFLPGYGIKK